MKTNKFSHCDQFVSLSFPQNINVYGLHRNQLLCASHPQRSLGTSIGLLICAVQLHVATSVTEPHSRVSLTIITLLLFLQQSPQKERAYLSLFYFAISSLNVSQLRGLSADHNKMTAFTGQYLQECMALQCDICRTESSIQV